MAHAYSHFKVLFIYPNIQMRTIAPPGIAQLAATLKEGGFACDVFDCTRYEQVYVNPERDYDSSHEKFMRMDIHKDRVSNSNVLPFHWGDRKISLKQTNMGEDLKRKINEFGPDLVAISLVENTYQLGMDLLELVPKNIPVIAGGVFCTYAPHIVIKNQRVNYVCRGEGEYPLLELCKALADGKSTHNIPNIWAKINGEVYQNAIRPAVDMDNLPMADFSIF